ncbi:S-adenosyl-L-methionine-dependent methyltransferase [Mycena venus]|uniref:S-adenosyl-L-methionine-dependent methyltransferase n=1 Tax=Mycena venus TaxID=2733690 RepID=A0A8H7CN51_9AGAR|nr:S-adenosyl-L-methionine-dependent methyltransferase [Mycena venus]
MPSTTALDTLLGLKEVLNLAIDAVSEEWKAHGFPASLQGPFSSIREDSLPTPRLYEATKRALGAADMLQALLRDPRDQLMACAAQYFESRALHAASAARIPDILHQAWLEGKSDGLTAEELSQKTGYEKNKCARIMRLLATSHIFNQTGPETFSNNRTSAALINNHALTNYIDLYGGESYASSQHLIEAFKDDSLALERAAFTQEKIYNPEGKTYWDYNDENSERHDMFATAMAGSAQTNLWALLNDYPWGKLGTATVVDVGGGIGSLSLPLLKKYEDLSVVIQDRESVIAQAENHWKTNYSTAIEDQRAVFQVADFFQRNKVCGAEVYMLRYIMDDWNDDACVKILSAIKASTLSIAPKPLLPNYGQPQRFIHCRDLNMMSLINGTERTVTEMTHVIESAGLVVEKIWECRGAVHITECVLPAGVSA